MPSCFHVSRQLVIGAIIAAYGFSVTGCGYSSGTVPVDGQISYCGEALPTATLTFFPETGRPVLASVLEGDYRTELVPGEYAVVVTVAIEMPQGYGRTHWNQLPPQTVKLPDHYTSRAKTPLKAAVTADQFESINFALQALPPQLSH